MILENIRLSFAVIFGAKLRSLLTMLGIIIGVSSVLIIISMGEGVKNQVTNSIIGLGASLISVTPGQSVKRNDDGSIKEVNFAEGFGTSTLSEADVESIRDIESVEAVAPIMVVPGTVKNSSEEVSTTTIIATNEQYPKALNQKVATGAFFKDDSTGNTAVIGSDIADEEFNGVSAVGKVITLRSENFIITGVLEKFESAFGVFGPDLNRGVFISIDKGKQLTNGVVSISEIDVSVQADADSNAIVKQIDEAVLQNHGGERDFSVIKQDEIIEITDQIFSVITSFVAAIAGISLFVGGIGIMNIMLVSVTERTKEIGLRKAVGATNWHILQQFLIEAVILSAIGGLLGTAFSYLVVQGISAFTDLRGSFAFSTVLLALGVSSGG